MDSLPGQISLKRGCPRDVVSCAYGSPLLCPMQGLEVRTVTGEWIPATPVRPLGYPEVDGGGGGAASDHLGS
jgi:hypothetical protein